MKTREEELKIRKEEIELAREQQQLMAQNSRDQMSVIKTNGEAAASTAATTANFNATATNACFYAKHV